VIMFKKFGIVCRRPCIRRWYSGSISQCYCHA